MNNVSLIGRLTRDVELRYTPTGLKVSRFTLAVNRRFKKEGQPDADFINCQIWNKPAETLAQYTKKGSLIGITGHIRTGNYDGQDGRKVFTTEVIVESFTFLEKRGDSEPTNSVDDKEMFEITDDDLPF